MTEPYERRRLPGATLLVVTYDPLRRKGFMKCKDPPTGVSVHFHLAILPEAFKKPVVELSRPLNYHANMSVEEFKNHMQAVKRAVVGARFRATLLEDARGRPLLARRTIVHLPESDEPGPGVASIG